MPEKSREAALSPAGKFSNEEFFAKGASSRTGIGALGFYFVSAESRLLRPGYKKTGKPRK